MRNIPRRSSLVLVVPVISVLVGACTKGTTGSSPGSASLGETIPLKRGLVLFDNVQAFEMPFSVAGTPVATFRTGDVVDIGSVRRKEEGPGEKLAYGIVHEKRDVWLDGASVYVPEQTWFFDSFRTGTWIPETPVGRPANDKQAVLNSVDFYARMAQHPDPSTRTIAFRKMLWLSDDPDSMVENWKGFFDEKDPAVRAQAMQDFATRCDTMKNQSAEQALQLIDKMIVYVHEDEKETLKNLRENISTSTNS